LSKAWKDITSTPHWFKRILTLCVMGCFPIFNFGVVGYSLRWSRDLSFGERKTMPRSIFRKKEISTGFLAVVAGIAWVCAVAIVVGLALLIVCGLISIVSVGAAAVFFYFLSCVALLAAAIFIAPVVDIALIRMSVVGYLEAALNIPTILRAYKRKMGSAVCAALVPGIAVSVASCVLGGIAAILCSILGYGSVQTYSYGYYSYAYNVGPTGFALFLCVLIAVIAIIAIVMMSTFANILTYRALGHWVAAYAPEWAEEAKQEGEGGVDASGKDFVESLKEKPTL